MIKRVQPAFTVLELMVSIALASMIMMGMVQGYRNAVGVLGKARELLSVNRRVALLFNQIERDYTTVMPYEKLTEMPRPTAKKGDEKTEDGKQEPEKPKQLEKKPKKGEKEEHILSLATETFDDAAYRYNHKKWQMMQRTSFVCTTPLEVFGSLQERRVRVGYELVYDKQKSSPQHSNYTLWRKETPELENMTFKEKEEGAPVRKHIVAEDIKAFSLEYTYKKRVEQSEKKNKSLQEPADEWVRTFSWGKDEELKKSALLFPQSVAVHLELWDEQRKRSYPFDCMVPLLLEVEPQTAKKDEKKQIENSIDKKSAQQASSEGAADAKKETPPEEGQQ